MNSVGDMRNKMMLWVISLSASIVLAGQMGAQSVERPVYRTPLISTHERKGPTATEVQKLSDPNFTNWRINYSRFSGLRSGGRSFSLDNKGNLVKRIQTTKTETNVAAEDLEEIVNLVRKLNLLRARTKTVKGWRIYDYPYWSFTIELDGKRFFMEGFSSHDENSVVLTKRQKQTFLRLNEKLADVGATR